MQSTASIISTIDSVMFFKNDVTLHVCSVGVV